MTEFINIGNGVFVNEDKIRIIMQADAGKVRRILNKKGLDKSSNLYWDAVGDKEIRSLIVLDDGMVVVSPVTSQSICKRKNIKSLEEI